MHWACPVLWDFKGGSGHFGLGGLWWQIQKDTIIRTPLGGTGGMPPPEKCLHIHALRQLLVRSEANVLPQIVPENLEDKLNSNGILVPIAIEIPGHVPELNLHAILKLTLKKQHAVLKIRILADFAGLVFRNLPPNHVVRSKNAPILIKDTF